MPMRYEDQVAIGANMNQAISNALRQQLGPDYPVADLVAAVAQAVLIQLDQAGYKIERK